MFNRRLLLGAALGGLSAPALAPALAQGQTFTLTLIVPFSPGSVVDIMARAFADGLRPALGPGSVVLVVNREGAGGGVGGMATAQARPDGTTLAFSPSGMFTTLPHLVSGLPYRFGSVEPICQTFENIFALAVPAASPYRDLAGLIAGAKAKPESVSWGDAGVGTVGNFIGRQVEGLAGVKLMHVPYRNQGQMILDAQGGALDAVITTWATLRESNMRVLAVAADARPPSLAQTPTFAELGLAVTSRGFGGLIAPRGLPRPVAQRLEKACLEATASPVYREVMDRTGQVVAPLGAEAFAARLRDEEAEAKGQIERLGISLQ